MVTQGFSSGPLDLESKFCGLDRATFPVLSSWQKEEHSELTDDSLGGAEGSKLWKRLYSGETKRESAIRNIKIRICI